jgi:dUTP pyrophosphatase
MNIKIKKLSKDAVIPSYAKIGDAALDLTAVSISYTDNYIEYGTGLAIEIPEGFGGFIFPRSSISNYDLSLCNSIGVVDSNYRGELKLRFKTVYNQKIYRIGDRIGQLVVLPVPKIELELTGELNDSVRGSSGFGSSGV